MKTWAASLRGVASLALVFALAPFATAPSCSGAEGGGGGSEVSCWLDEATGLCWQDPTGVADHNNDINGWDAVEYCAGLGDGWRLPTIDELRSLIRGCPATEIGGSCGVTDPECLDPFDECADGCGITEGCADHAGPGVNGWYWPAELQEDEEHEFWSSSDADSEGDPKPYEDGSTAWKVSFDTGAVGSGGKGEDLGARCVRDGG